MRKCSVRAPRSKSTVRSAFRAARDSTYEVLLHFLNSSIWNIKPELLLSNCQREPEFTPSAEAGLQDKRRQSLLVSVTGSKIKQACLDLRKPRRALPSPLKHSGSKVFETNETHAISFSAMYCFTYTTDKEPVLTASGTCECLTWSRHVGRAKEFRARARCGPKRSALKHPERKAVQHVRAKMVSFRAEFLAHVTASSFAKRL